ncbi:hypothetical protein SDRG_10431 [Saprolegnia diclina VS20]|uniref:Uncharacterized protein n=1 Tax=Saprolegnia diclina (strain VS20) TaxID=1156394 RepID=T0Q257_SAPDV|nr:hypothetical protein SDRG_10431 [Saprolegnia diclina VS20]EQC31914.1 hypothetical protein SDRG_10431 [Saprolegnia diclina VS20]|eukprot:XP_008614642.1 hypothetical protein SDRG_10431 [Saprolegnia diclina VS20]
MWLYEAANQAAKERVVQVQEKASIIVAQVQDEAQTLLNSMSLQQENPSTSIFEKLDDYKAFLVVIDVDDKTEEVAAILNDTSWTSAR